MKRHLFKKTYKTSENSESLWHLSRFPPSHACTSEKGGSIWVGSCSQEPPDHFCPSSQLRAVVSSQEGRAISNSHQKLHSIHKGPLVVQVLPLAQQTKYQEPIHPSPSLQVGQRCHNGRGKPGREVGAYTQHCAYEARVSFQETLAPRLGGARVRGRL